MCMISPVDEEQHTMLPYTFFGIEFTDAEANHGTFSSHFHFSF